MFGDTDSDEAECAVGTRPDTRAAPEERVSTREEDTHEQRTKPLGGDPNASPHGT